ncbi:hypothetical protein JKF63_03493 [Porcisia hertigi]|uniref:Uncharacterized protein n=1 Tax=Porcisia hertigi TaxID=2761500 RepID=A0A836HWL9_9TRYP|nr:hypothetical protein JKF63_03493 [Porcisia hertigi]
MTSSRTSSMYVSPNLGPTVPWGQQTSTGVFRPPPAISLNVSSTDIPQHVGKTAPPGYSSGVGSETADEHGLGLDLASAPHYPLGDGVQHDGRNGTGSQVAPSPPLGSISSPYYPKSCFCGVPVPPVVANPHGVAGASNGDGGGSAATYPVDRIMKMISYSVHLEEDTFLAKKESNRVLEKELQHEQDLRRDTQQQLEVLDERLQTLQGIREAQSRLGANFGLTL